MLHSLTYTSKLTVRVDYERTVRTCNNIPSAPAYGVVYFSQLIQCSRDCGSCHDLLDRGLLPARMPLNQGFLVVKLKSSPTLALRSPP